MRCHTTHKRRRASQVSKRRRRRSKGLTTWGRHRHAAKMHSSHEQRRRCRSYVSSAPFSCSQPLGECRLWGAQLLFQCWVRDYWLRDQLGCRACQHLDLLCTLAPAGLWRLVAGGAVRPRPCTRKRHSLAPSARNADGYKCDVVHALDISPRRAVPAAVPRRGHDQERGSRTTYPSCFQLGQLPKPTAALHCAVLLCSQRFNNCMSLPLQRPPSARCRPRMCCPPSGQHRQLVVSPSKAGRCYELTRSCQHHNVHEPRRRTRMQCA
jgi:hypothetical protein